MRGSAVGRTPLAVQCSQNGGQRKRTGLHPADDEPVAEVTGS